MPGFFSSLRLCTVAGIHVYIHWSWFVVAYFEIVHRINPYTSLAWNVAEYLTLFGIVLLHEFGHALACRQVGGTANRIVLWPLGGAAMVQPPPRPLATLWCIAAGPLVNLLLVPLTVVLLWSGHSAGWDESWPDAYQFVTSITTLNTVLLVFNLLPIYTLDGGRILQALLWPVLGRATSLTVVSVIGIVCGLGGLAVAFSLGDGWLIFLAAFVALAAFGGFSQAQQLARPGMDALEQGGIDLANGAYVDAEARCYEALAQLGDDKAALVTGLVHRGVARMALNDLERARTDFQLAVQTLPLPETLLARASLSIYEGKFMAALSDLSAALDRKPNLTGARALRGLAHWRLGDAAAADDDSTAALKQDGSNVAALLVRCAVRGTDYASAVRGRPDTVADDPASPVFPLTAAAYCRVVADALQDVLTEAKVAVATRSLQPQ